jgi:hypothetical protein
MNPLTKQYASLIIKIIVVAAVVYIIWKTYKSAKSGATVLGEKAGELIVSEQTGIPTARIQICKEVAESLHKDHFYYWLDYAVDEEAWINALNRLETAAETVLMCQYFREKNGRSVRSIAYDDFSAKERSRVKQIVWNNLI